ncbi:MAG: glycosyltransferase N-terminal domain-containing protein [Phycisphaerales bacterium]|nr:glycosyltransferase N-terminal domain-containing protein [Phycisphaerales bacterium]
MTRIVDMVLLLAAAATALWWVPRMIARGRHRTDWRGRFGHAEALPPPPAGGRVVLHAVSVGEVGAIRGLVDALAAKQDMDIVIASTTDTGVARANELFGDRHAVVRWPLDFSWAVKRFLKAVQPTVVGLVELEVWPNATAICKARGIPTVVVSGRLSDRSHRRYRWIRSLVRPMFRRLAAVGAQSREIADRFVDLGAAKERVHVVGNLKWDSVQLADGDSEHTNRLAMDLGIDQSKPIVVGGSTAPGEEAMLREACPEGVQLLCAPRRPEWWDEAAEVLAPCVRRSSGESGRKGTSRFLLDTIGELGWAYGFADVVVVGRSFGDLHGSDPVEPIARGAATVIGPAVSDFKNTIDVLVAGGGLIQCLPEQLSSTLHDLLANPKVRDELVQQGQRVIHEQQGATARCVALLLEPGAAV